MPALGMVTRPTVIQPIADIANRTKEKIARGRVRKKGTRQHFAPSLPRSVAQMRVVIEEKWIPETVQVRHDRNGPDQA